MEKYPKFLPLQECLVSTCFCLSFASLLQKLPAPAAGWGILLFLSLASCPQHHLQPWGSTQARFSPAKNTFQNYLASEDQRSDSEPLSLEVNSLPWTKQKQSEVYLGKKPKLKGMQISSLSARGLPLEATLQRGDSGDEDLCEVAQWKSFTFKEDNNICFS